VAAELRPGLDYLELVPEELVFPPQGSKLDSMGRILVKPGNYPQGEVTLFSEVVLPEANPIPIKALLGGSLAILMAMEGLRIGGATMENNADWQRAQENTPAFIAENQNILSNLSIGATFSPEQMGVTPRNIHTKDGKKAQKEALAALDYMQKDLGMKDIRIGVRWENVVDSNGNFDFSFYKPYFDKMIKNKTNITLNVGIKTERYPEQNDPEQYLDLLKRISETTGVVYPEDDLAKYAIAYETEVYKYLQANYSKEQLAQIKVIQVENEAFNKFGENPVVMSNAYVEQSIENANKYFPEATFAINSAGPLNVEQIVNVFKDLIAKDPTYKNRLLLLINNYDIDLGLIDTNTPIGEVNPLRVPGADKVDPLWWDRITFNQIQAAINEAPIVGFTVAPGEAQAEPWDGNPTLPGDPVEDFKYTILRSAKMRVQNEPWIMSVWGIEYLLKNPTPENKAILKLIGEINAHTYIRGSIEPRMVENFKVKNNKEVTLVTLPGNRYSSGKLKEFPEVE
jgi:hypothetical protein